MSLDWYSLNIALQSDNSVVFDGYFSVDNRSNTIQHFITSANTTENLIVHTNDDYAADYKFISNKFTIGGTAFSSIPILEAFYLQTYSINISEWSIWHDATMTNVGITSLSYKNASDGNWYDIGEYGQVFTFTILSTSPPQPIPSVFNKLFLLEMFISGETTHFFQAFMSVDINTNTINNMYTPSSPSINILKYTNDDNYSDYKLVNNNFTPYGTSITSIPLLDASYGAVQWQIWSYLNKNYLYYKDANDEWYIVEPLNESNKFIINVTSLESNIPCFNHGTKILCLNKMLEEEYIPIQRLKSGDVVKTYLQGYRKIKNIGLNKFMNNPSDTYKCMYTMKKDKHPDLIEDLTITGGHSILINYVCRKDRIRLNKMLQGVRTIGDKQLILSCISELFNKIENNNEYVYFHFCVDTNEKQKGEKFAVWSNGFLTEIPSENEFTGLDLIPIV